MFPHLLTQYITYIVHPPCILLGHEKTHGIFPLLLLRIFPVWLYTCHSKWLTRIRSRFTSLRVIQLILSDLLFCRSTRIKLKWHSTGWSIWRHWNAPFPTSQRMSLVGKVFRANYSQPRPSYVKMSVIGERKGCAGCDEAHSVVWSRNRFEF